jgi:phage baseplate assembly protein W
MAQKRIYTQVDPINLETDVAVGVPFPFNADGVFYSSYTTKEQVKSNLLNVLLTEPGERLYNPLFGVGIRNLLFEQGIDLEKLRSRIKMQTEIYVPEITITDVVVNKAPHSHVLFIRLTYKLNINNDPDSIQLNFNETVE